MINSQENFSLYSNLVREIADYFGGVPGLARALGSTRNSIYQWQITGIPRGRAFEIEVLSSGNLKAIEILKKQSRLYKNAAPRCRSLSTKH